MTFERQKLIQPTASGAEECKAACLPKLITGDPGGFCLSEAGKVATPFPGRAELAKREMATSSMGQRWAGATPGMRSASCTGGPCRCFERLTCFLEGRGTEGLHVGKSENKTVITASSTCPLTSKNVRVPEANILGQVGHSYKYAIGIPSGCRVGVAAQRLRLPRGCFECTIPHIKERAQFGKRTFDFQGLQHQKAQVATQLETTTLLTQRR